MDDFGGGGVVMMGQAVGKQGRLFYEFDLDDRVPANHLLRRIDAVLDLMWLRSELKPFYSHTGCPSVDPELMIRMLLIGYCYSIRSERRLCREVELNLAYRWFCRLGLEDRVPNHSTFSVNRHGRFRASDVLRKVFESIVRQCMASGERCLIASPSSSPFTFDEGFSGSGVVFAVGLGRCIMGFGTKPPIVHSVLATR